PIPIVLPVETSSMEIDPLKESSSNNLDKKKGPVVITSTSTSETTAPKLTVSIDESFDTSENILNTSTIGFDVLSTQ
ncbi:11465_t:CDS:1, partial [Funneliformis caledonium]